MNKMILATICWLILGNLLQADEEKGQLTHDLTVGANHDIHLKAHQVVQVLNQSGQTAVIMVALPDGSNGVYQVGAADIEITTTNAAASFPQSKVPRPLDQSTSLGLRRI